MLMKDLIAAFSTQMREAISIGEKAVQSPSQNEIRNIVVTGLGGSGIGGTIMAQVAEKELKVPLTVNKDYFIPSFTDKHTLVIVSSYSGNTEETISAMEGALKAGAKITCVTSGGKIADMAAKNNCDVIKIPGGMPPRACFAYSFTQLFYILEYHKLISSNFRKDLESSVNLLDKEENAIMKSANEIAGKLIGKMPVIYCEARYEGIAVRFRQQINENSKMLCWHHVLPEMNHNELVGWTENHPEVAVVMFKNADDYSRTKHRMKILSDVVQRYTENFIEIESKGDTQLQRSLYLLHFGDWVTWYIAERKDIDATEVNIIDFLKSELAKI